MYGALCTGGSVTSFIKEGQRYTHTCMYGGKENERCFSNNPPSQRAFSDKTLFMYVSFSKQLMKYIELHTCKLYKTYYIYKLKNSIIMQI